MSLKTLKELFNNAIKRFPKGAGSMKKREKRTDKNLPSNKTHDHRVYLMTRKEDELRNPSLSKSRRAMLRHEIDELQARCPTHRGG